jgi:hypothetical protein
VEGVDLARLVKQRGPLPVAEACELARQTALALQYLQQRGLVHRDLKPSNVMRTPEGVVKLLDLGLARWRSEAPAAGDLTAPRQVLGTPDFVAPEQIEEAAGVDIRADLYALGCTLFYLLAGRAPFADRTHLWSKLDAHRKETPPDVRRLRPEVPAALAELVARLLAKRPEQRPQSPAEVAAALAEFTNPLGVPEPSQLRGKRRWLVCSAAAAGLVLLAGVLAWRNRPAPPPDPPGQEPLRVREIQVQHFANINNRNDRSRGFLGKDSFATRLDDSVVVAAELSRPAHAFLIAFRPDGTEEVCFPENEDEPPRLTDRPRYPSLSRGVNYGLNEGTGLQVFALVASDRPLPAYREWRAQLGKSPWGKHTTPDDVVWFDNGGFVDSLTVNRLDRSERGKGRAMAGKTALVRLTDWLQGAPGVEAAAAIGFAVLPKEQP